MINIKNVTKLINSIYQNDINNLKVRKESTEITINKIKISQKQNKALNTINNNQNNSKNINLIDQEIEKKQDRKNNNKIEHASIYSTIISPMVGTFYKSPAPNEPSFIEVGETAKPKQIVCIIEAMKLMNEIESEVTGEVVEILVKDGDIVDCGQALMKIKVK
uniref:acetyl-CoA carboxylase, biotin carboxyl carrierprotein n=1 Tax=Lophurella stichidiosa TaxID=2008659 RepID=UPI002551D999|nr:acetyl-CoA carboxylase, biotin carboxyl carrierprotein [Aphanocladia stichidiosa]WGH13995.1 acetyl-CoA carboxylase, biotin carboxyl carrierprotein [Aphanocladia stichidiosa]